MHTLSSNKGVSLGLMLAGIGLMNVAMFLHPMSPEDFLGLALSNPLQTLADTQGGAAALLFWVGVPVSLAGIAGLASCVAAAMRRLHLAHAHRLPAH